MLNSNTTKDADLRIYQIIDANLDRAREGLRVLEDWARFGLGKEKYVEKIKNFRQIFCLLYTSPSPRDVKRSRMPSSA